MNIVFVVGRLKVGRCEDEMQVGDYVFQSTTNERYLPEPSETPINTVQQ